MKDLIEGEGEDASQKEEEIDNNATHEPGDVNAEDNTDPLTGYKPLTFHDPMELSFLAEMPYNITILTMPDLTSIRSTWRGGVTELETIFMQMLSKMNLEFEAKCVEFDRMRDMLAANHAFLLQWYKDMQAKLNEKNAMILLERQKWEMEKSVVKEMVDMESEVIPLNVGGTHHLMTERAVLTLCKGSVLESMFNGLHELKKINDEVFLDRDGQTFLNLVNYLRNDRFVFPEFLDRNDEIHFFKELDYWKIPTRPGYTYKSASGGGCNHCCSSKNVESHMKRVTIDEKETAAKQLRNTSIERQAARHTTETVRQTVQVKSSQSLHTAVPKMVPQSYMMVHEEVTDTSMGNEDSHGVALKAAKDKWNELGPLRLDDIVANSQISIDQSLVFGQSKYNKYIIGQLGGNGKVTGVGKEINHIIYEGQFVNDVYNGYGRFIYSNGNYYIGNWLDGKRSGYGKLVDKQGKVYEGQWQYSKYMGA